jgi:hypothetical protein
MLIGCLLSTTYVFRHFRRFPFRSIARTFVASCVVVAVSITLPASGLLLVGKYLLLLLVFPALLLLLGEIKKSDV